MKARQSHTTALLLFIRNEEQEAQLKPLALGAGRRVNVRLLRTLNRYARQQIKRSGLPLIVVKGAQQIGATFGERLANAFELAFAKGFTRVIAIGNDCLHLNTARLKKAAQELESADLVLGPALDGGVYLLGINRRAYQRKAFIGLPWQTEFLFHALEYSFLSVAGQPALLDQEEDADDPAAFRRLVGQLPAHSMLSRSLRNLLGVSAFLSVPHHFHSPLLNQQHPLRGPPPASAS